ncbi:unnamed protein product [Closterium sp. Yama58-4]|nr:unnamed protein product [Closterium sp. Yama58-4]
MSTACHWRLSVCCAAALPPSTPSAALSWPRNPRSLLPLPAEYRVSLVALSKACCAAAPPRSMPSSPSVLSWPRNPPCLQQRQIVMLGYREYTLTLLAADESTRMAAHYTVHPILLDVLVAKANAVEGAGIN